MTSRIGMLTPSSNTVLEPVTCRLAAPFADRLSVHFSRFRVTEISDAQYSHDQFHVSPMLEAAKLLTDAHVNMIAWNGTSGSWEGIDKDLALVQTIQAEAHVPATTSTLALLDAFRALNVRRFGLVVPYVDTITGRIKETFVNAGFECVASTNENISINYQFAEIPASTLRERIKQVAQARPDAIAIHCTNLCGADVAQELEEELGIPIIDSVVVTLWAMLRYLKIDAPLPGFTSSYTLSK
jgi:Maleate cis-trans isomerase